MGVGEGRGRRIGEGRRRGEVHTNLDPVQGMKDSTCMFARALRETERQRPCIRKE